MVRAWRLLLAKILRDEGTTIMKVRIACISIALAASLPASAADWNDGAGHNIFLNAAQAMRGSGSISVKTTVLADTIEIAIRDSGPGLAQEVQAKVFSPFFTTKPSGEGTGLGLAISHEIAHEHSGSIAAGNHPDGGALFTVSLPRHALHKT